MVGIVVVSVTVVEGFSMARIVGVSICVMVVVGRGGDKSGGG